LKPGTPQTEFLTVLIMTLNPGSLLFRYFSHRTATSQITWKSEPDSLQKKEMCVFSQHPDH